MECPNCQHKNRAAAKFCENCGHVLQIICPNCGRSNRPGAKFCDNCGHNLNGGEKTPVEALPARSPISRFIPKELASKLESARADHAMEGERRVVTILFCDVKGSTQAAEQLDPEDWTEIMNGAFEHMIQPVYQYEGTVARLMGDALLAFFGAPIAHEDDPQRALLAGLGIVNGMRDYRAQVKQDWGIDFDVRVGINTGLVVVGAVGSDLRMEYTAMGDATNLAARMEQTAEPGTVQIAEDTYRLVASLFEFKDLGGVQVKGKAEPVQSYRVLGFRAVPGRQHGIAGLEAPLIGRARERSALEEAIANLGKGLGGIVYLLGEAGMGKSRLLQEVAHSNVEGPALNWFEAPSLSYETEQPYSLFRRLISRVIGSTPNDGPEEMREKIQPVVEKFPPEERAQVQRVFEQLFGLPGKDGEPALEGETFKGLLYSVTASFWQRRAERGPVVLVCDDLHWSDPASVALLQHLYPLTNRAAILLLCAMRPEREAPAWQGMQVAERDFPHRYTEIRLQPLNASESGELIDSLLRISDLPAGLRNRIMEKSEGNPYFVEEVVRTLIDRGVVVRDEAAACWRATGEGEDLDIPGNLQSLLVARIDRLADEARRTLQVASVVGRSFYYRIVQRLVDFAAEELDLHLLTLERMQFIQEAARLPELEYLFRHTLTQEAAYSTILLKERRVYHRRVGETLEVLYPDQREEMARPLADHFFQARDFGKALKYYTLAGDAAFRLHAVAEAIAHYSQALACAQKVALDDGQLIHLYTRLGRAFELNNQFEAALRNYQEMIAVAAERESGSLKLASLSAQCIIRATQTPLYDPPQARALAEQALTLARQLDDRTTEAKVLWGMLLVEAWGNGDNHKALEYGLRSLELAGELGLREQMGYTYTNLVNVYWNLDQLEAARKANREAQAIWEESGNLPMLADAYTMKQNALLFEGKTETILEIAQKSLQLSQSIGNAWNQLTALHFMIHAYVEQVEVSRAIEAMGEYSRLAEETGFFRIGGLANRLWLYLAIGALKETEPIADALYEARDQYIPFFRPWYMALIVREKIGRGLLEQAGRILKEAYQGVDLDNSPILYTGFLPLAEIHLSLALQDPERALERTGYLVETIRRVGFRQILPEALWLHGKVQLALNQRAQARRTLKQALVASQENGERRVRWQILSTLAKLEVRSGNASGAEKLREQAGEIITSIADHSPPDLRAAFLALPEVRNLVDGKG
jgi:class 3 adenylate cyclase/tetratricopeptide (TPR) repeat protein